MKYINKHKTLKVLLIGIILEIIAYSMAIIFEPHLNFLIIFGFYMAWLLTHITVHSGSIFALLLYDIIVFLLLWLEYSVLTLLFIQVINVVYSHKK